MNKFINKIHRDTQGNVVGCEYEDTLFTPVISSLLRNNTFCPAVDHVVYTLKTYEDKAVTDKNGALVMDTKTGKPVRHRTKIDPVLSTTVYFKDGTKTTVVNSEHDKVMLDKDGLATVESRELGIVYALAKRLFGVPDEHGKVNGDGLGRKLRLLVEGGAYSKKPEPEPVKEEKKEGKKEEKKSETRKTKVKKSLPVKK